MRKTKVVKGTKYGKWTTIREAEPRLYFCGRKLRMVLCKCDCGLRKEVSLNTLVNGKGLGCRKCYSESRKINIKIIKKKCQKCGMIKLTTEFSKHETNNDGFDNKCKDCRKEIAHLKRCKTGKYVYVITHPLFNGWVKIGVTTNLVKRLNSYQTHDPTRSYKVYFNKWFEDSYYAEKYFKDNVSSNGYEWFSISEEEAKSIIIKLSKSDFKAP